MDVGEVLQECPIRGEAAQPGLPGMHVGVDEARKDDPTAGVDHLGIAGLDPGPNRRDPIPLDQQISLRQIPQVIVHGDDGRAPEQPLGHQCHAGSACAAQRAPRRMISVT